MGRRACDGVQGTVALKGVGVTCIARSWEWNRFEGFHWDCYLVSTLRRLSDA